MSKRAWRNLLPRPGPGDAVLIRLAAVFLVVARTFPEIAFHVIYQFGGEGSLYLAAAVSPRHPGAMGAMIRIRRAVLLASALLKFPTVHALLLPWLKFRGY